MVWYAESVDNLHPPVELKPGVVISLGRAEETGIKDKAVSKLHLLLKYQPVKNNVICKHLGTHPSIINGVKVSKDMKVRIGLSSTIQLLRGRYHYRIVSNVSTTGTKKRVLPDNTTNPETVKKHKIPTSRAMSEKFKDFILDQMTCDVNDNEVWHINKSMIVYTPSNCKPSSKIAAYDLDHTLIKTKSGRVFPKDINDWEVMWPGRVIPKLKQIHKEGYKIVIITNQGGIEKRKVTVEEFKSKTEKIISNLGVPVQVLASIRSNVYRKPMPGMWVALERLFNGSVPVNLELSYYVGDAAGREADVATKRRKDFSCSDREFARNIGISFYTPEVHFLGEKPTDNWSWKSFDPVSYELSNPQLSSSTDLFRDSQEAIIFVGFPGSGKSSFCSKHLANYVRLNMDDMKSHKKCLDTMTSALKNGESVVVDNTFPDLASRAKYLAVIKELKVPARCFIMATSLEHSRHNNRYRRILNKTDEVPAIAYNTYKSRYVEPTLDEGFSEVVNVNFVMDLSKEKSYKTEFYKMFLGS